MASSASASSSSSSIFVSIASYRDSQCQYTIQDLFEKATHPERVVAGVCFQVADEDEDSFLLDLTTWAARVRTYFLRHEEAMGPCYARALIQQELFKGEDYYFQIDSHFRFVQGWDEVCLEQLSKCDGPKPILTAYASSYTLPKDYTPGEPDRAMLSTSKAVTVICADEFGDQNKDDPFLRIKTRTCRSDFGHIPPPALFWTARFAFSRGSVVREVPYDPKLEYIFFGEEIGMAARLWTSGWDFFNPTRTIGYHLGSRAHRQWFREVQTTPERIQREKTAKGRLCGLLGTVWPDGQRHTAPAAPYSLGSARSLQAYEDFVGVNFHGLTVSDHARRGGVSADLLPPRWAEEEKEKIMLANQLQDTASWAGKGNSGALERQFPEAARAKEKLVPAACGSQAARAKAPAAPKVAPRAETERARELTRMRIHSLQAQLRDADEDDAPGIELELSKAFSSLGQVEAAGGDEKCAADAFQRALEHADAAQEHASSSSEHADDPGWRASAAQAGCGACLGLRLYGDAKARLKTVLALVTDAIRRRSGGGEALEELICSVVDAIHQAHEQTDDRKGLEEFSSGIQALLQGMQQSAGKEPIAPMPTISGSESLPEGGNVSVRARILERIVLIFIATGREKDFEAAKNVFRQFRLARESPNLRRLLGMVQSSGNLLGD